MNNGIGYVNREDYNPFCLYYIKATSFKKTHTMDLAYAKYHNLVLDIDFKGQFTPLDKSHYMQNYLKPTLKSFFDEIPCFTFITATRDYGGLHVHLPEFLITHDDYIYLCTQLQERMNVHHSPNYSVEVDIPTSFTLSTASKPDVPVYKPFNITFIEGNTEICLPLDTSANYAREYRTTKFKNKKNNSNSIFRKLIYYPYNQMMDEVLRCMMPFVIHSGIQSRRITYKTMISNESINEYQPICTVLYDTGTQRILKSNKLNFKSLDWMTVYNFLNNQCFSIRSIDTQYHALTYWYNLIQSNIKTYNDIFHDVNDRIKKDDPCWRNEDHPLKVIMMYDNGIYFLPVFYALCKIIEDKSPHELLGYFSGTSLDPVINRLKMMDERIFVDISDKFTIETVLYCASIYRIAIRRKENSSKLGCSIDEKIDEVLEEMRPTIMDCKTKLDFESVIQKIVQRYTPIISGMYKHSSKKQAKLLWNIVHEYWQDFSNESIRHHVQLIYKRMEYFLQRNKKEMGAFITIHVNEVTSSLQAIANMEQKEIAMDQHKIHIRTRAGLLNLLVGHISVSVPEFFMSNKFVGMHFTRPEFNRFYNDGDLERVYDVIMSKKFFRRFLKCLLMDVSDDYFDTIKTLAEEFQIYPGYQHIDSILQFYCHLCKYMSFDYDMVIFMIYVISSIFIATNYYRHFFVFQGNTKNGKSKFFEMIDRTFGSYNHSIRSMNLQTSKSASCGPQPELAASLHCTRIISVEEMHGKIDENLIKILTGNSQVSCRTLYETNSGGIPTAKVFASTNNPPECTATDAFRDRVLAIPFSSSFSERCPTLLSEQVMKNVYKIDLSDAIVQNSFQGMFVLSYYNLIRNFDQETGLINLPPIPIKMAEFKDEYLRMTDIYAQFKQYVDVQIVPDTKTLYNHLVSAVRKFLINTKSHLTLESLILKRFDEEFSFYKCENSYDYDFNAAPEEEEEEGEGEGEDGGVGDGEKSECSSESASKRLKLTTIYYENVNIRKEMSSKRLY